MSRVISPPRDHGIEPAVATVLRNLEVMVEYMEIAL